MYVVAGVTGRTGSVAAETLLAQGEPVRVIVREARQGESWKSKGAEVAVASLADARAVAQALKGARGAYLLVPPRYEAPDMLAAQRPLIDALAEAVRASAVPHVVLLSSVGAELSEGTGPVRTLHYAERTLGAASRNITFLRAGYFFENFAAVLPAVQGGVLPTFLTPDRVAPMVASADIGRVAAELLLEPATGTRVVELQSALAYSPERIAKELSERLGRPIATQHGPLEAVVPALTGLGFNAGVAGLFREMTAALNDGRMAFHGGNVVRRFGTLRAVDVLAPLLEPTPAIS